MTALDITRTIDIAAPVQRVWAALTQPDLIAQWFGDSVQFDATPGGQALFGWSGHDHGPFAAVVETIDEPKTLVYRWARQAHVAPTVGNSTVVRFDLTETGAGTRLTLTETGFEELHDPQAHRDGNASGWAAELADLVAFAEGR